jgi:hypothetical protein
MPGVMAGPNGDPENRVVELEELTMQPGTYFNPQTEVVVIVDDSASIDQEVFDGSAFQGADWVRVSDEVPIDEDSRDRVLESFETRHGGEVLPASALEPGEDDLGDDEDKERPERDPDLDEDAV